MWGQCSLVLLTYSWFFHKFNKRYIFTCYKSSCSNNLLIQSCLLILLSHLVVRYSQHSPTIETSMIKYYSFRGSSILSFANSVVLTVILISEAFLQHSRSVLVPRLMVWYYRIFPKNVDVVQLALSKTAPSFNVLTFLSFLGYTSVMIPMFLCALFGSSPLITTASPTVP